MPFHAPEICPRIDRRGVAYHSALAARFQPLSRYCAVGTATPVETPTAAMPASGTGRFCAEAVCAAPARQTIVNRAVSRIHLSSADSRGEDAPATWVYVQSPGRLRGRRIGHNMSGLRGPE